MEKRERKRKCGERFAAISGFVHINNGERDFGKYKMTFGNLLINVD